MGNQNISEKVSVVLVFSLTLFHNLLASFIQALGIIASDLKQEAPPLKERTIVGREYLESFIPS